ncbi:MAG TPA: saccharopine dehydrogenase NADP-binding domain-containing protein [Kofleriaceae bacterium]|jgi:short subunit dehydrogenase-like uncharacterized protein
MIVVYGASGLVGKHACAELAGDAWRPAGRADDLARAFAGARVVVNCAGPLRETAARVLEAALAAGAHYVDVGGEQAVMHALYEQHESAARHAGLVALPGAGVDCLLGDLAAALAAEHVCGSASDASSEIRTAPAARLAEDAPLDEIAVTYAYDHLALSPGSQRALFGGLANRPLVWQRDRWEPGRAGDTRRVNAGPSFGERDAIAFAGGDALSIPRHIAAQRVATYVSATQRMRALGLLARALPFLPRTATDLLAPYAAPDADYTRTLFGVVAQVRRGFSAAQVIVRGRDVYRSTAVIAVWAARALRDRASGPVGMRAPGELLHALPSLRQLARRAGLAIEPSFGRAITDGN